MHVTDSFLQYLSIVTFTYRLGGIEPQADIGPNAGRRASRVREYDEHGISKRFGGGDH